MFVQLSLALLLLLTACEFGGAGDRETKIKRFGVESKTVVLGEKVSFSWSLTLAQTAQNVTCELEAGDGANYVIDCTEGEQRHVYEEPGTYTAKLSITGGREALAVAVERDIEVTRSGPVAEFRALTWQPRTSQPEAVGEAQGEVVGGKLYVFGGFDSTKGCCTPTARAQVYDPMADTWSALSEMPPMNGTEHGGVTHAGTATDGKDIYFAGGYTSNRGGDGQIFGTSEVWAYDVSEDRYSRLPDLPQTPESGPDNRHSAGQLEYLNGRLHLFGGTSADRKSDVVYHFVLDLAEAASAWTEAAPLPEPRNHLGSAVLDGKLYAVGGQTGHDGGLTTHDDVYVYSPRDDAWTAVQSLPKAVSHISNSSFVMDGRIIVVGGEVGHLKAVRDVFAYNPDTDVWTSLTDLPVALQSMVSGALNGDIYVTGGSGGRGGDVSGFRDETYKGVPQN